MYSWNVLLWVNSKCQAFLWVILDSILLKWEIHVKWLAKSLPGVAGSVEILKNISIKNLIHVFFWTDVDHTFLLCQSVHDINLSHFLSQSSNHVFFSIVPPWDIEMCSFSLWVRHGTWAWDVQESAVWSVVGLEVSCWVNVSLWLSVETVKPMADVCSSCQQNWITEAALRVFSDQLSEIKGLVEEWDPAIISCIVDCDFRWEIESSDLIIARQIFKISLIIFDWSGPWHLGSWYSCSAFITDFSFWNGGHF